MSQLSIFVGSVYGNAQHTAETLQAKLSEQGIDSQLFTEPTLDDFSQAKSILFVSSTTGDGEIPPNLEFFVYDLKDRFPLITGVPFAVAALGDSSYDHFCGAGDSIYDLLVELQGEPVADTLKIDAIETLEPEKELLAWFAEIQDKLVR